MASKTSKAASQGVADEELWGYDATNPYRDPAEREAWYRGWKSTVGTPRFGEYEGSHEDLRCFPERGRP
jgi:hypothetical protein